MERPGPCGGATNPGKDRGVRGFAPGNACHREGAWCLYRCFSSHLTTKSALEQSRGTEIGSNLPAAEDGRHTEPQVDSGYWGFSCCCNFSIIWRFICSGSKVVTGPVMWSL